MGDATKVDNDGPPSYTLRMTINLDFTDSVLISANKPCGDRARTLPRGC